MPTQPSSQIPRDTGGSLNQNAQRAPGQDSDSAALTGRKGPTAPVPVVISAGRVQGDCPPEKVKSERRAVANEVINLAVDSDKESVGDLSTDVVKGGPGHVQANVANDADDSDDSTDYKELCQKLTLKLVARKEKESHRKKEIIQLKKTIRRLNTLLSQDQLSSV